MKLLERCLVFQKATDVAISGADSQVSLESSEKAAEIDSTTVGAKATVSSTSSTETAASEQIRIDNILKKLFFSPGNLVISEGTVFDASIR